MRVAMIAWVIGLVLITGLYIIGPAAGLNRAAPPILGMPPLYFWFVLVPLLNPLILGAVYLIDRAYNDGGDEA
jgi:hypothetical protein